MSIASEIQALQQDKDDIAAAITSKGVTVPSGSGFDNFAGLISSIPSGSSKVDYYEGTITPDSKVYQIKVYLDAEHLNIDPLKVVAVEIVEVEPPATENIQMNSIKYIGCTYGLYYSTGVNNNYKYNPYGYRYYDVAGSTHIARGAQTGDYGVNSCMYIRNYQGPGPNDGLFVNFQVDTSTHFFTANIQYKYRIYYSTI